MEDEGDEAKEGFATFYQREYPRLARNLFMDKFDEQVAKDAAQKAMIDAYTRWDELTNPAAWVRTAARRHAKHLEEQDRRRHERDSKYMQGAYPATADGAEQEAEWKEEARAVLRLISTMPPQRQKVVALAFDGWKTEEIAQKLGLEQPTVRSHLRHARRVLEAGGKRPKGESS